jgi:hypothetical protein
LGNDSELGIEARCRALLSHNADADNLYREAIDRLGRTRLRPELARAYLLHGEWLRRQSRRVQARKQRRTAHEMLTMIGMAAFAERAPGADRRRRDGPQAQRRDRHHADRAGLRRMHASGGYSIADLAELFTVSRPTVYQTRQRSPASPPR